MTQILLIDSSIQDYEEVVKSVNRNTIPILYNKNYTFSDLSNAITERIDRIGIFCHDSAVYDTFYSNVSNMIDFIQHNSIKQIDFLACNTLNNPEWVNYYSQLPCIVGATNTYTGSNGGDWIMQSTGENIEFIYFEQINYKYVLSINSTLYTDTPAISAEGYIKGCYLKIEDFFLIMVKGKIIYWKTGVTVSLDLGISSDTSSIYVYNSTISYMIYGFTSSSSTVLNVSSISSTGVLTTTSLLDIAVNITKTTNFGFYNNYLYYSVASNTLSLPSIGRFLITNNGSSPPTASNNNNNYINSASLSYNSANPTFPTGITCDTNGKLYIIMGNITNVTSSSVSVNILIYDLNTNNCSILCSVPAATYGMPITLLYYNDFLYIGTYCGSYNDARVTSPQSPTANGTTSGQGYILTYYSNTLLSYVYTFNVGVMLFGSHSVSSTVNKIYINHLTTYPVYTAGVPGRPAGRGRPAVAPIPASTTYTYSIAYFDPLKKSSFFSPGNYDLRNMFLTGTNALTINGNAITNKYNVNNVDINTLYQNNSVTPIYYGRNTGYYIISGNFYWDIANFFTFSTYVISPTLSTIITGATGLRCSTPTNFNTSFTVVGNSSNNANIGTYTIYGAGTYYLLINGILSPYYKSTINANTGEFVYITGTNRIEIFTNGSVIASFRMPNATNLNGIAVTSSTAYLYTTSTWTSTAISSTGYVNYTPTSNTGSTGGGSFGITSGGLNTKIYDVAVNFNNSAQNIAYYYNTATATYNNRIMDKQYITIPFNISSSSFLGFTPTNAKWGFKSVGYFLPNVSGTWRFNLFANSLAQFCIGSNNGTPISINPNINACPQCLSKDGSPPASPIYPYAGTINIPNSNWSMTYKTDDTYGTITSTVDVNSNISVTLSANTYYPVLIYYGSGAYKFQLTFTDPNDNVYSANSLTYNSFLYYTNIYPNY